MVRIWTGEVSLLKSTSSPLPLMKKVSWGLLEGWLAGMLRASKM